MSHPQDRVWPEVLPDFDSIRITSYETFLLKQEALRRKLTSFKTPEERDAFFARMRRESQEIAADLRQKFDDWKRRIAEEDEIERNRLLHSFEDREPAVRKRRQPTP